MCLTVTVCVCVIVCPVYHAVNGTENTFTQYFSLSQSLSLSLLIKVMNSYNTDTELRKKRREVYFNITTFNYENFK